MEQNKHYISTDNAGRILSGWSDGPCPGRDVTGAVLLREDGGYQFRLTEGGEENPPLTNDLGAHFWRYGGGAVRASTEGEIAAERAEIEGASPPPPPTDAERIAQLEAAFRESDRLKDAKIAALTDQGDFQEDLIVELAGVVYA